MATITVKHETTIQVPDYGRSMQIDELKDIVTRSGSHFFDRDTMRYFRSRIELYEVGGFQAYETLGTARTAARRAAKGSTICPSCRLRIMRRWMHETETCGECYARKVQAS